MVHRIRIMRVTVAALLLVVTCAAAIVVAREAPKTKEQPATIQLDLKYIKARVMKEQNWSAEFTEAVAVEYKRFWALHAAHPDAYLVPSLAVDEMWHAHILFTAKYAADCQRVFGSFLHHYPTIEDGEGADATAETTEPVGTEKHVDMKSEKQSDYDQTLALYESEFGVKPNHVWVKQQQQQSSESDDAAGCGSTCHAATKKSDAAGCSNCSNCGSKCKNKTGGAAAGCGNCHAGGDKTAKNDKQSAGCGNCHASKKSAGCGHCHAKSSKKSTAVAAGYATYTARHNKAAV